MSKERYVAYVGTYTHGTSVGIHIFDVDMEKGALIWRKVVPINNPSHLTVSKDGRFLYSIADEGVAAFHVLPDGDLEFMNQEWIGGMRGCFVEVDSKNRFLFVAGYHDGRVSMMHLLEDGKIGKIADGIFHKGIGRSIVERSSVPHVTCVRITPCRERYVCAVDSGLDHVKVYKVDARKGKLKIADILRCPLDSGPRKLCFSADGNFAYVLCELKRTVEVYKYTCSPDGPVFDWVQSVSTGEKRKYTNCMACDMQISDDGKHIFCSNAGTNTVVVFEVNHDDGTLTQICESTISGDYPKTLGVFPDGKHFVSLNHETNEITTFAIDYKKKHFLMSAKPISIDTPNCIHFHRLADEA